MHNGKTKTTLNVRLPAATFKRKQALRISLLAVLLVLPMFVSAQSYTLNLKDADIGALINTVSELTGKNFVVDPRVKGRVTVISAHPMEKDEIYKVFLSILEVHGFSTVPSGDVIKIIPEVKAKQANIPLAAPGSNVPGDQMVTRVIQVKNVTAAQLVPILRPLVPQQGHLAAYPSTNVLIISDRASNVKRLVNIISRIDQATDSEIDIIPLKHASATEVVRVLNSLQQKVVKGPVDTQVKLAADERTNSVLLSGERSARLRLRAIIADLDNPLESGGNTHVIYLHYAKAKDLLPVLSGISSSIEQEQKKRGAAKTLKSPINIQADEASNALVVTAPPDLLRSLRTVISKLDIRRAQVHVEAIIAEVSWNMTKELGVEWIVDGTPGGSGPVGVINFSSATGIAGVAATVAGGGIPAIGDGATLGFGKFNSSSINFAALIRALDADGETNILSTPSLTTLDNQPAEIVIGQNVPFVTGEYASTGATTTSVNPFRTIERQDVGITLRVTPQVNEGDAVKLDIEQEVSSLSASAVGASDLITNKRVIKTTVMVDDGKTIVLGGLLDENLTQNNQKVPLLGDIPVMGNLFKSRRSKKVKRNLMVFLRPVILRDAATETRLTHGKYNYLRAQQVKIGKEGFDLFGSDVSPVLPKRFTDLPAPFDPVPGTPTH